MISVVFSFKNEEENILELVERTIKVLDKINIDYEIIFVDDCSTDNSKKIIKELILKNEKIKYILMNRTFGTAPCLLAGLKNAKGDYIVYLDSDLQDPPEIIEKMHEKTKEGYEVVHTKRSKREGENFLKIIVYKFAYYVLNKILSIKLEQNAGDFKMLSKKVVKTILDMNEKDPYMRGLPSWTGYKDTIVLYDRLKRYKGETKFPFFISSNPWKEFFRGVVSFSSFPLYLILISGLVSFLIFISLFLYFLIFSNLNDNFLFLSILFFFSIIQSSIGTLGLYIEKILKSSSKRPDYIISEKIGFGQK